MATRPSVFPEWATTLSNNGPLGGPSRVEPASGDKATGFLFPQKPPREWFNWLFYTTYQWLFYLDQEVTAGGNSSFAQDANTTTGLTFGYKAGLFHKREDNTVTEVSAGTVALTASETNYIVYRPGTGVAKVITLWSNTTDGDIPLYKVVTGVSSITSVTDLRGISNGAFDGSIDTNALAADSVTYAKMQNVSAASRLLGRGAAAGSGDPEEITLGTGLTMSGTTLNATVASAATETVAGIVELATDAEAQAFTADKVIDGAKLNTAFKGGNQSLTTTGYQKLPGGLIIQWGKYTSSIAANTTVDINLPTTFPNAVLFGNASRFTTEVAKESAIHWTSTTSVFTITHPSDASTAGDFSWFVVGY